MLSLDTINREIENILAHGNNRADIACLADLYVCRDALRDQTSAETITASGSEFAACINGKCFNDILPFLDELLETLKLVQPRLYDSFMRRLR